DFESKIKVLGELCEKIMKTKLKRPNYDSEYHKEILIRNLRAVLEEIKMSDKIEDLSIPESCCTVSKFKDVATKQKAFYCDDCDMQICDGCKKSCHADHRVEDDGDAVIACECMFKYGECKNLNICTFKFT